MTFIARALLPFFVASQSSIPATCPAGAPSETAELTAGGLVWSLSFDNTWPTPSVALGDRGGQVPVVRTSYPFAFDLALFSSFDADPPTPILTIPTPPLQVIAASETDDYLTVGWRTRDIESIGNLRRFTSRSNAYAWKFEFAQQAFSVPLADISRDGRTIVSSFYVDATQTTEVRVHDPATGAALQSFVLPVPTWGVDLSPDGSVVVLGNSSGAGPSFVVDLATESVLYTAIGRPPARQALSDEGRVLAISNESDPTTNHFQVFVRGSGGYQLVLDVPMPHEVNLYDAAVSEDGSTVVAGWGGFVAPYQSIVRAYDVASATMTMERIQPASAWIFPSDVAISVSGSRFVAGLYGPGSASHAQLAVYRRDSSQPLAEQQLAGGVYAVDMSPDGKRYAAGSLPTSQGPATSSSISLYELGGEDFAVRGRPSIGATVTFELHGAPGARAMLLRSFALAPNPIDVPGAGRLHLDPASLAATPMGVVPPSGPATVAVTLDLLPGTVGRTVFYQGLTTGPRKLTRDWVQLTIVP